MLTAGTISDDYLYVWHEMNTSYKLKFIERNKLSEYLKQFLFIRFKTVQCNVGSAKRSGLYNGLEFA